MSSSGKGQSTIRNKEDIQKAWDYAIEGSRGDLSEVIVEEFINFDYEITLLTLTQKVILHYFVLRLDIDKREGIIKNWQPMPMDENHLTEAQQIAEKITKSLGGAGIWG